MRFEFGLSAFNLRLAKILSSHETEVAPIHTALVGAFLLTPIKLTAGIGVAASGAFASDLLSFFFLAEETTTSFWHQHERCPAIYTRLLGA